MEKKVLLVNLFNSLNKDCEINLSEYFVDDCKVFYNVANKQNGLFATKNNIHELEVHLTIVKFVFLKLFKEYKVGVGNIVCDDDSAAVEWGIQGINQDGTQVTCKAASFFNFQNEKILSETQYWEDYYVFDGLIGKFGLEKTIGDFIQDLTKNK